MPNASIDPLFMHPASRYDAGAMKETKTYRWHVIERGRPRITPTHLSEEQVRRDYPECVPEPVPDSLHILMQPDTAEEMLDAAARTPNPYGPSNA